MNHDESHRNQPNEKQEKNVFAKLMSINVFS